MGKKSVSGHPSTTRRLLLPQALYLRLTTGRDTFSRLVAFHGATPVQCLQKRRPHPGYLSTAGPCTPHQNTPGVERNEEIEARFPVPLKDPNQTVVPRRAIPTGVDTLSLLPQRRERNDE